LIDYLFAQTCHKTAQAMAAEHEQDSQAPLCFKGKRNEKKN